MSKRARRHDAPAFKANVVLAVTLAQLAEHRRAPEPDRAVKVPSLRKRRPRYLALQEATERPSLP
ncbi:hypothetical protein ACVIN2_003160 [Bradyrhizobium sp. USDA 3650]